MQARNRRINEARPSPAKQGYGYRWQKAREVYLQRHPFCECPDCRAQGRLLPATVVDHRIPHRGDMALFWDVSNWQAMSKRCHDRKTARETGGFAGRHAHG
jgi:5-methylcytosine-specific restriction protein A